MTATKRAQRGLGSIKQRKNGRWAWAIKFNDPDSDDCIRMARERRTREDAVTAGRKALAEYYAGKVAVEPRQDTTAPPQQDTVATWYSSWLGKVLGRTEGWSNTPNDLPGQVLGQIFPGIGQIRMSDLTTADVTRLLDTITAQSMRTTVHKTLALGWQVAFGEGLVTDRAVIRRASVKRDSKGVNGGVALATTKKESDARMLAFLHNWTSPPPIADCSSHREKEPGNGD